VFADAACDADHFRRLVRDDLDAEARIPSSPSRAGALPLDRALHAERRLIETFFNCLKRFRRIALRCEKTPPAFVAFVHLACAMNWLR
jgi:putative transposase